MSHSLFSPFKVRLFLAVWIATLISNFGMQIHTMAAGWLMLRLDPSPQMVALVQVAASLPFMLFALLAGTLSDIFDKRKIMLLAQLFSITAAALLAYLTYVDSITPVSLLALILAIAAGTSFFSPTWAASVSSMVPRKYLAEAVSLNAINYNLGRSLAPALGGMLITVLGIAWAFILNTLSYLGIVFVLLRWKPEKADPNPDREPILWAVTMGFRYVFRTEHIRVVIIRTVLCSTGAGVFWSLMPVLAKQHLGGDATTFTVLLTALGIGSVFGGLLGTRLRQQMGIQRSSVAAQFVIALSGVSVIFTDSLIICSLAIAVLGFAWMVFIPNMNASIQLSAPDWVVGRMLAMFQSTILLGFAVGGLLWGWVASEYSISTAFALAALVTLLSAIYGIYRPMLGLDEVNNENANLPEVAPELKRTDTGSSPIVVTISYRVAQKNTSGFLDAMAQLKSVRLRLGAVNWTLQQELEDPEHWIERYISKDWDDQLRRPKRYSQHDNEARLKAQAFDVNNSPGYAYMVIRNPAQTKNIPELFP